MCLAVRILDSFKTWKPYFMVDCEFETDWEKWKTNGKDLGKCIMVVAEKDRKEY